MKYKDGRRCIVPNCDGKHSLRHTLPKKDAQRKLWLQAVSREDLIGKPYRELCNAKVCGAHFNVTNYRTAESILLNRNAVPIKIDSSVSQQSDLITSLKDMPKKKICVAKECKFVVKPFHRLPKNKELRDKWLHNLGRDDLRKVPYTTIKYKMACGSHFESSQFNYPGCDRLLRNALPRQIQPDETSKSSINPINNDIIDNLIKDAPIATGEVTAPLLCDNKVLLKTKSTYSKNKYKMTFDNNADTMKPEHEPFIIEDVFKESGSDGLNDTEIISLKSTTKTKPVKLNKQVSILKNTDNKKRKHNEIESDFIELYDDQLFVILEQIKSLPNFLDVIFGFLYRRTDYFQTSTDPNIGVGLPNGVAQKLLQQTFKKYEAKHENHEIRSSENEQIKCDANKITVDKSVLTKVSNKPSSEPQIFDTYNGAVFKNYAWSQSITDIDIQLKIPDKIACKQLDIDITATQLTIKVKNSETVYLKGELCDMCKMDETVWSLGGHILQIHLEKQSESWWDCLLKFDKIVCSPQKFHELTEDIVCDASS